MDYLFKVWRPLATLRHSVTKILKSGQEARYFAAVNQFDILKRNWFTPRHVVFQEIWKSKADLDAHLQTPHMVNFFKSINFDPSLYTVLANGNTVVFTPKPGFSNYVIEMLKLEGFEKH